MRSWPPYLGSHTWKYQRLDPSGLVASLLGITKCLFSPYSLRSRRASESQNLNLIGSCSEWSAWYLASASICRGSAVSLLIPLKSSQKTLYPIDGASYSTCMPSYYGNPTKRKGAIGQLEQCLKKNLASARLSNRVLFGPMIFLLSHFG